MKYKLARQHYNDFSGLASSAARQLAFAGIAAIWIFRPAASEGLGLPSGLMPSMAGLALFLLFDLLQYVYAAAAWGIYQYHYEDIARVNKPDDMLEAEIPSSPDWINYATLAFFWLKLLCLTFALALFAGWLIL